MRVGKKIAIIVGIIAILFIIFFIVIPSVTFNSQKILNGVKLKGISANIGNSSVAKAKDILHEYQLMLNNKEIVLDYEGKSVTFKGEDVDLKFSDDIMEKAHKIGRSGNYFSKLITGIMSLFGAEIGTVDVELSLDEDALQAEVDSIIISSGSTALDDRFETTEDAIVILKGHDGIRPDYEDAKKIILEDANNFKEPTKGTISATVDKAKSADFDELYKSVYIKEEDAQLTAGGGYVKEKEGVSFDVEQAKTEYASLQPDQKMTIKLIKTQPKVTTENLEQVLFADLLSTFTTKYDASNINRSTNLSLASNSINNKILVPGEEFSYNEALGERTAARGYKEAHVYSGGQVVDGLGGGICQISSTLYNAVLKADLEVTSRTNHMFYPQYVDPSFDATVVWGSIDFTFKNNRETPIKIVASSKSGIATVSIYGIRTSNDYTIELYCNRITKTNYKTETKNDPNMLEGKREKIQTGVVGYVSEGYKIYKDGNGNEVNRELISKDTYQPTNEIYKVGTKKVITPEPKPTVEVIVIKPTPVIVVPEPVNTPTPSPRPTNTPTPTKARPVGWPEGWDTPENPAFKG